MSAFWQQNGRLLVFLLLFLIGASLGCPAYRYGADTLKALPSVFLIEPTTGTAATDELTVFGHALIGSGLLLLILMAAGLSAIGAPVVFAVLFLFGVSVGFTEAYVFSSDGLWRMAFILLPPTMLLLWTLLMAACESLRMTLRIVGQVMPRTAGAGGLWTDFKRFLLRYWIFAALTILSAALQTLLICIA